MVYCFEADAENVQIISNGIRLNNLQDKISIVQAGLGEKAGQLWYTSNFPSSGRVGDKQYPNSVAIPVISIDDFCAKYKIIPDFIKMDIEGSEFATLMGAQQTLKTHKPRLAICIYHSLDDMWRIPLLIHQFVPEYKLYCKKNYPGFAEFVLYAMAE